MKRILAAFFAIIMGGMVTTAVIPQGNVYAGECAKTFMGMRPWYMGLTDMVDGKCVVKIEQIDADNPDNGAVKIVWTIVLNILTDIMVMIGYVAIIFIIYGGYKYIMSAGEPGNIVAAKKTIFNAIVGLVIGLLGAIIINTIIMVLDSAAS